MRDERIMYAFEISIEIRDSKTQYRTMCSTRKFSRLYSKNPRRAFGFAFEFRIVMATGRVYVHVIALACPRGGRCWWMERHCVSQYYYFGDFAQSARKRPCRNNGIAFDSYKAIYKAEYWHFCISIRYASTANYLQEKIHSTIYNFMLRPGHGMHSCCWRLSLRFCLA